MAIRLLASWQDYPAGAFVYRDSAFEVKMVQQGLASFDLSGGFHWPLPQVEGTIGPLSSVSMLSQYPPGLYLGFTAIAGGRRLCKQRCRVGRDIHRVYCLG